MYHDIMFISAVVSEEEYAALLRAMESAGFADESAFLRYIMLQAVDAEFSAR